MTMATIDVPNDLKTPRVLVNALKIKVKRRNK